MSQPEAYELFWDKPAFVHAFNSDRSLLAVSPNNNQVQIFRKSKGLWQLAYTLEEHDKLVTGIDWAPKSNRIVSCSQDRNAYVWQYDQKSDSWKPTLVNLRINRAATTAKWSPNEQKFAVGSGARVICICYFEEENNWWVSKHLKKPLKSTVLSIDWHPDNILIVAGSADKRARVFSAHIKGLDKATPNAVWGEKLPFGTVCGDFGSDTTGWVHGVAFSPSGNAIAFVGHDSTVTVVSPSQSINSTVSTNSLPLTSLVFTSETQLIAAGHDCSPCLFQKVGQQWEFVSIVDKSQKKEVGGNTAMNKFRQMDSRNQTASNDTELSTIHQNTITCVRVYAGSPNSVSKFSTSGVDGKLVIWDLLASGVGGMRL